MSPARRPGATAPGVSLKLVLALYALVVALLPLAHHDIVCHIKSSTHCTTCVVGSSAESAADPAPFWPHAPIDAGSVSCAGSQHIEPLSLGVRTGRAPPALA